MTLKEKILTGRLQRKTVERVQIDLKIKLRVLESRANDCINDHDRNIFIEKNDFRGLNQAIVDGEKILETMKNLGV